MQWRTQGDARGAEAALLCVFVNMTPIKSESLHTGTVIRIFKINFFFQILAPP